MVLIEIQQKALYYTVYSMSFIVHKAYVDSCFEIIDGLKDIMSEEPAMIKKANSELNQLKKFLLGLQS